MAKVLISPIGVGPHDPRKEIGEREYRQAEYKFAQEGKTYKTPFFAAALADYLKVDKIIFIGTAKSMWEEVYRYFAQNAGLELDYDYWIKIGGLTEQSSYDKSLIARENLGQAMGAVDSYLNTKNLGATGGSSPIIIDYGLNEDELWKNFGEIMSLIDILEDGDEIYLDITHAFRSIPLFMYLMMEFLQGLAYKRVTLKGLYYGMLDANRDLGYAPVVDLSPLYNISQWIRGTHDFINFGDGYTIGSLLKEQDGGEASMKLARRVKNVSELVNINYLTDLQQQIQGIDKLLDKEYRDIKPVEYIMPLINNFVKRFSGLDRASDFQLELSKWYFENRRYGHGYICLVEAVLTRLCEVYALDLRVIANRDRVKDLVADRRYQRMDARLKGLADKYHAINDIRNRIAHASFYSGGNYSFATDIDQAMKNYEDIKRLLNHEDINKLDSTIPLDIVGIKRRN